MVVVVVVGLEIEVVSPCPCVLSLSWLTEGVESGTDGELVLVVAVSVMVVVDVVRGELCYCSG